MEVIKNKYGFYEMAEKPTEQELKEYYADKYFQNETGAYSNSYTENELKLFKNKIEQRFHLIQSFRNNNQKPGRLLDIGSGEGFVLSYYKNIGWDVMGLDFSEFGCQQNNPDCLENMRCGNLYVELDKLLEEQEKFDVIIMQNLLEHVTNPSKLLDDIKGLMHEDTVVVVTVPNDFSPLQNKLFDEKKIDNKFWIVYPDHLSYFTKDGLKNIFTDKGYEVKDFISDFPIDLFLLNNHSNYISNKSVGSQAHQSRIMFENLIHQISVEKTNDLYRAMAEMEIGRQYTILVKLKQ